MSQKYSIFLFNQENPRGQMFNLTNEQIEQYQEDGWQDSPKGLELPENEDTGITKEQVENLRPEDLIAMVKSYGFIVTTAEQMKAEANKMASMVLDITKFDDEAIIAEAERRGLKDSEAPALASIATELDALMERFEEDPKALNKDELVALGNNQFSLGLRSNMKEDTLIAKIVVAIEGE